MKDSTRFKETEIGMIPEDWEVRKLGTLGEVRTGKGTKILISGKYQIIGSNGLLGYTDDYLEDKDLIYTGRVGTIGKINYQKRDKIWLSDNVLYFTTNNLNLLKFIYYFLRKINFSYLNVGSTQPLVKQSDFKELKLAIPKNKNEQSTIVKILSSLDDKIELNRKMNKTLEEIGQAIFKHWFVDFEFPNEQGKPYKSSGGEMVYNEELGKEIPKGWKWGALSDLIEEKRIKIGNRKAQVLSAIKTGELMHSEDFFTKKVYSINISKYLEVNRFDFAYNPARINIGSIGLLKKNILGAVSPVYVVFSCKNNSHYFIEKMLKQNSIKNQIIQFCSGTVRQILDFGGFKRIRLLIPSEDLFTTYNYFYEKLLSYQEFIKKEIDTLSQIRDLLLPKLMSGKIRVPLEEKDND
jgi:type I restriction enzyme S subunit